MLAEIVRSHEITGTASVRASGIVSPPAHSDSTPLLMLSPYPDHGRSHPRLASPTCMCVCACG